MVDTLSPLERSERMRRIRSKNTKIEWVVRRLLFALGYRYRLRSSALPGKPDIIFPRRKTAIFVHGCFWHQHPGCKISHLPKSRSDYWKSKLDRNVERDTENTEALKVMGWKVIVIWECETRNLELLASTLQESLSL
jgi:DNA mismatch endonuclease (patch repair protein)